MTYSILTDTSTQKSFPRTQPTDRHFILIIYQLINVGVNIFCVLHIVGRDVRGHTNFTRIQLHITSTCVSLSPAGSSGYLV